MKITLFVAAVMLLGIMVSGSALRAADTGLCGDGIADAGEQCDDGNLKNGDGCSGQCTVEECGNGIVDPNEQCDNGSRNGTAGNICSLSCMILFCGDGIVDEGIGEECDDGNNVPGDGCSPTCQLENGHAAASSASSSAAPPPPTPAPVVRRIVPTPPVQPVLPRIQTQADTVLLFLLGEDGAEILSYLSDEEKAALLAIVTKLTRGEKLSADERDIAAALAEKLEEIKNTMRTTYIDLLRSFIASVISSDVVNEKNMKRDRLTGTDVRAIIRELNTRATVLPAEEIPTTIGAEVTDLVNIGISSEELTSDEVMRVIAERSPLKVFSAVKSLKEATERFATTDLPASLESIRRQAQSLRESLPDLERAYDLGSADLDSLLATIVTLTESTETEDRETLVRKVAELTKILSDADILSLEELSPDGPVLHAAASAEKLAQEFAPAGSVTTKEDAVAFVRSLAKQAPDEYRTAFESGTIEDQKQSLLSLVRDSSQTATMLASLRDDDLATFNRRIATLTADIGNIGNGGETLTPCDDSVSAALSCVNVFLADLEETARSQSTVKRVIGRLQDYFGIGLD